MTNDEIQHAVNRLSELCNELGVVLIGTCTGEQIHAEIEVIPRSEITAGNYTVNEVGGINSEHNTPPDMPILGLWGEPPTLFAQIGKI